MQITLSPEQEKLIQEELNSGEYQNPNDVITAALQLLKNRTSSQPQKATLVTGEPARKMLEEKVRQARKLKSDRSQDNPRAKLAERFRELCRETQELHADNPLTEEDIAAEIDAYRRGE
ncbi:MAG: hypothetical protein F6K35_30125 [Okeania sp. SIO2H7]|nr:hypothetical protein [Okeania sp. SIO2H7]